MFNSLKVRLFILILLVAIPGALAILLNTHNARELAIESNTKQAVETARRLSLAQKSIIDQTRAFLEHLASLPHIQNPSSPECGEYLSKIIRLNSTFANLGVPRADGELLCNAFPLKKRVNVFDRTYFQDSLHNQSFSIGTYQLDRAAEQTSVNFSYPVLKDNEVVGLVVAVVSLDWWSQQLSDYLLPSGAIAFITDAEQNIVANFPVDASKHGKPSSQYGVTIDSRRTYDYFNETIIGSDKLTRVFTHNTLYQKGNHTNVTVSVGIPIDHKIAEADTAFIVTLASFGLFLALSTYIAVRGFFSGIVLPITRLTQAVKELENGQFPSTYTSSKIIELNELEHGFKHMAEARLKAEKTSDRRREELDSVFGALPDLYFRLKPDGTILDFIAPDPSKLYTAPEHFLGKKMSDVLPPDAGAIISDNLKQFFDDKVLTQWEYPLVIDDEQQFFEARAVGIRDFKEAVLIIRDITEKKKAEESLRLAARVYENSSECMVVTDKSARILNVNRAFCVVTGYSAEEVIGKNASILSSGRHDKFFYKQLWTHLLNEGHWDGEIYNRRRNGEIFPERLSINAIYDEDHRIEQYVALYQDITDQKKASEMIWRQAHFDSLTGLPNRDTLKDRIDQEIIKAGRNDSWVALLFLDLDQFKEINDTLGHDKGDLLLQQVAGRLGSCVRRDDTVARLGGDEFTIVLGGLHSITPAETVANKVLEDFISPFILDGEPTYITTSIGISLYPHDASSSAELLKTADQAMYEAKANGGSRFHCFTKSIQDAAVKRMQLIRDLRQGLETDAFELYYQPIVSLADLSIHKAEALIRWNHPQIGRVSPDSFIPLAEETKLIEPLGAWIFEEACHAITEFQQKRGESFQLSINLSPAQFSSVKHDIMHWLPMLKDNHLSGSSMVAEITEGLLMDGSPDVLQKLLAFRDAGIQVALDDFGTGYSSLAYIQEYDIDFLKIDQRFVKDLSTTSQSFALCEAIIVMSHQLGIKVIAEGVETIEQMQLLQQANCDYAQGFLFSKPVPKEAFNQLDAQYTL